ncbi:hypothetical protein IW261DRAFT_939698 [Armillaria novae-zelandiae]|uniref:Uncharacterized protein n=1 Tax=Armillaria novae-zelandiae TaxID=153914 RepID=A0AA39PFH4_9AGAR|nr:hypothetical protein IW261DRAFT_939698 [Armillaria novae-zelandiae]
MPCHRSRKEFAHGPPPTYDEALHASSSLYLPTGVHVARYQPYSLSYRVQYSMAFSSMPFADLFQSERQYTDIPVPQSPPMILQTGRSIVPPPHDLDDYVEYNGEETDEDEDEDDEDDWDDEDEDDQESDAGVLTLVRLSILIFYCLGIWLCWKVFVSSLLPCIPMPSVL